MLHCTTTLKGNRLSQFTSHIIFNDVGLNSTNTIYRNIYQNFLLTAMKMHHYVRSWKLDVEAHSSFLLSTHPALVAKLAIPTTTQMSSVR